MSLLTAAKRQPSSFLDWPALAPPEGVESNFNTRNNLQGWSYAITITTFAFATTSVMMRTYTKARIIRKMNIVDCLSIVPSKIFYTDYDQTLSLYPGSVKAKGRWSFAEFAKIFFTANFLLSMIDIAKGVWGLHQWDMRVRDISSLIYVQPTQPTIG